MTLKLKLIYEKEIRVYQGSTKLEKLREYIQKNFKNLPEENYYLGYIKLENQEIFIEKSEDLEQIHQFSKKQDKPSKQKLMILSEQSELKGKWNLYQKQTIQNEVNSFEVLPDLNQHTFQSMSSEQDQQQKEEGQQKPKKKSTNFFSKIAQKFSISFNKKSKSKKNDQKSENNKNLKPINQDSFLVISQIPEKNKQTTDNNNNNEQINENNDTDTQQEKILVKKFEYLVRHKAAEVYNIIGGEVQDYYGYIDKNQEKSIEFFVEKFQEDPSLTEKYSSYFLLM